MANVYGSRMSRSVRYGETSVGFRPALVSPAPVRPYYTDGAFSPSNFLLFSFVWNLCARATRRSSRKTWILLSLRHHLIPALNACIVQLAHDELVCQHCDRSSGHCAHHVGAHASVECSPAFLL